MIQKIHKFTPETLQKIIHLIYTTFMYCNKKDSSEKLQTKMKYLFGTKKLNQETLESFKTSEILIISKEKERINGIIRGSKNKIINLYVDPSTQGKGIGNKLLKKYIEEAKKMGSQNIFLKPSKYAYNFYIKHGFTKKDEKYLEKNI